MSGVLVQMNPNGEAVHTDLQTPSVEKDMDPVEDLDFDPKEVVWHAKDSSGLDAVPIPSQPHAEFSVKKTPREILQHSEGVGHRVSPDEDFLDSFEYLDDAVLNEATQHIPRSFNHQSTSHEPRMTPSQYVDDTVFDGDIQHSAGTDHQASFHEDHSQSSKDAGGSDLDQASHGNGGITHLASEDEEYMDLLDDAAFEESMYIEQQCRLPQVARQPSTSLQEHSVSQQVTHDAGGHVIHQAASHEVMHDANMHTSTDPTIEEGLQHSQIPSLPWKLAHEPDKETPEDLAFKEGIQYAYENDLTTDYLLTSFSITAIFGKLVQSTISTTNKDEFTDHSHLPVAEIPNPVILDNIKTLTITPCALRLIAETRFIQSEDVVESMTEELCSPKTPTKLELPILRTDNDRDLKAFHERSRACRDALLSSIKKHRLPLYPQNIEEGEGMEPSSETRAESATMMKRSEEEKLAVTRDLLMYLINQLKDEYTLEDQMRYIIDEVKYEKTPGPEKITPPVSPKLKPKDFAPVFDPVLVPVHSDDSSSLLSDNFRAIEDIMLGDHQDVWSAGTSPIREFLENAITISDQDALLERPRQTLEDMKVEVPLMLDRPLPQPEQSALNVFTELVETEVDLDSEFERAVIHDFSDDDSEDKLQEQLEEATGTAMKSIEQEQLQAIDAVGRVPVPVMDFSMPEPEWKRLCSSENSEAVLFKWIRAGKEQLFKPPSWPLDRAAGSKMVWSPLGPGVGNVPENEAMHEGEPLLNQYLLISPSNEVPTSLDLVHRRGRAAVFNDDDRDEDIETQLTRKRSTVDLLKAVRKRSMHANAEGTPKRPRHTIQQTTLDQSVQAAGLCLLPGDSPGASDNLLANFMEVHAPKKRVWTHSNFFASTQSDVPSLPAQTLPSAKQDNTQALEQPKAGFEAPCLTIEPPAAALTIFISIRIPRRMIRVLEGLIPGLTLLERNYDAHNTFVWKPGSVVRTEVVPPLADDADLTVSPSTGLIVTSMIRVRQKPRTGTNKGMVQTRVEKASLRYERLIVLVGGEGGKSDVVDKMSPSDSTALLELHGFVSALECNVQVHYVGGGEKTLANWVAACICRHGLVEPQIVAGLLEPESLWEIFLRRAGFNVFAAQAVAGQLKPPSDATNVAHSAQYGLGAFMTMNGAERMRLFGQLVGPKVLDRVNRNVDELWNHA